MYQDDRYPIQASFSMKLPYHNLVTIIFYVDTQTLLETQKETCSRYGKKTQFDKLLAISCYYRVYVLKTDRSIYLNFYQHFDFLQLQQEVIGANGIQKISGFQFLYQGLDRVFQTMRLQMEDLESRNDVIQLLKKVVEDPELPLPNMRKQGLGLYSNSSFQFFLVDKFFPNEQKMFLGQCIEQLRYYLQALKPSANSFLTITCNIKTIQNFLKKMTKISLKNYQDFIIPGFTLHNLVVLITALIDGIACGFELWILNYEFKFDRFVEYVMRYCVWRSLVLEFEEKVGFIFREYKEVLEGTIPMDSQLELWKMAMGKWEQHMHKYHEQNCRVSLEVINQIRQKKLHESLDDIFPENSTAMSVKNVLESNQYCIESSSKISPMYVYFEKNIDMLQQIAFEFMESLVDTSVNKLSVHWCGHTLQLLGEAFQSWDVMFRQYNEYYFQHLRKQLAIIKKPIGNILIQLYQWELDYLDRGFIKPATLTYIQQNANQIINALKQEGLDGEVEIQLEQRNKKLQYFNEQAQIPSQLHSNHKEDLKFCFEKLGESAETNAEELVQE